MSLSWGRPSRFGSFMLRSIHAQVHTDPIALSLGSYMIQKETGMYTVPQARGSKGQNALRGEPEMYTISQA